MRKLTLPRFLLLTSIIISGLTAPMLQGQKEDAKPLLRGSLVEDRAARKLIEAGETRYDAGEKDKSIEIWKIRTGALSTQQASLYRPHATRQPFP